MLLNQKLKEILLRDRILSESDIEKAFNEQKSSGRALGSILSKIIPEDRFAIVLSEALKIPIINLSLFDITPDLLKLIPNSVAETYQLIPISKIEDQLTVAFADPLDIFAFDVVSAVSGLSVTKVMAKGKDVKAAIDKFYALNNDHNISLEEALKNITNPQELEWLKPNLYSSDHQQVGDFLQEDELVKLMNTIMEQTLHSKSSHIFIEPLENSLRIRYRIGGVLYETQQMSKALGSLVVLFIRSRSHLNLTTHDLPQDGHLRLRGPENQAVDFRVNISPTAQGEKITLKALDKNASILDLNQLGFEFDSLARLKECCQKSHGLVLVCGPSSSGKTTTLYSIVNYMNSLHKKIVTVEDPIEYVIKDCNQINIQNELGLTFSVALNSLLQQDPDVILIGELRDSYALNMTIKASVSGHLILSSLRTPTTVGAITRMMNMGIEPFLICSSLNCLVAQRLMRRLCPHCREAYSLSSEIIKQFQIDQLMPGHSGTFYRHRGCEKCYQTGYEGFTGLMETLVLSSEIKELILTKATEAEMKECARAQGMKTIRENAVLKACQGITSLQEVVRLTAID